MFKCNNIKCRKTIQKICLTTSCSHIFCKNCMLYVKKSKICTACKLQLQDNDFTVKELDCIPNLAGFKINDIIECSRLAISFYLYQNEQEYAILNAVNDDIEKEYFKLKHEIKSIKANYELEIESLKLNMERIERSLDKERNSNYDLQVQLDEKSKQFQKYMVNNSKYKTFIGKINEQ